MTLLSRSVRQLYTSQIRRQSTFPYPAQPNPTPHQIFHLPPNAPQEAIKTRYYELVKLYHPDASAGSALSSEVTEARFQAITKAYDVLRKGKAKAAPMNDLHDLGSTVSDQRRKRHFRRRAELNVGMDERWKERIMAGVLVGSIGVFVWQVSEMRREGVAAAIENGRQRQRYRMDDFGSSERARQNHDRRTKETIRDEQQLAWVDSSSSDSKKDS